MNCLYMALMFLNAFAVDQNVINVDSSEYIKTILQNVIHVALKETWSFTKTKRHDQVLK